MWGHFRMCLRIFRMQLKNISLRYSTKNFTKEKYFDFSKIFKNERLYCGGEDLVDEITILKSAMIKVKMLKLRNFEKNL